jgi:hypothetical protein
VSSPRRSSRSPRSSGGSSEFELKPRSSPRESPYGLPTFGRDDIDEGAEGAPSTPENARKSYLRPAAEDEEFSSSVIRLARINGVLIYHDRPSVQVAAGENILRIFAPRSKKLVKHAIDLGEVSWCRLGLNPKSRDVHVQLPNKRYLLRFANVDETDRFVERIHRGGAQLRGSVSPREIPSDTTSAMSGATSTSATSSRPGTGRSWLKK